MSITRINEFQSSEGNSEKLFEFLKSILPYILSSKGCLSCEVLRDTDDVDKFVVLEKWENIDYHKKSIEAFPKEEIQNAMTLFEIPPRGRYYKV